MSVDSWPPVGISLHKNAEKRRLSDADTFNTDSKRLCRQPATWTSADVPIVTPSSPVRQPPAKLLVDSDTPLPNSEYPQSVTYDTCFGVVSIVESLSKMY